MVLKLPVEMDSDFVFYAVLIFLWTEYLWEAYLGYRQRQIYKTQTTPPVELKDILDEETFDKARRYALDKSNFGAVQGLFSQVLSTLIIAVYGFKIVWDYAGKLNKELGYGRHEEIIRSLIFVFIFNVFNKVIGLPFAIYETFVLEEFHGFNKQTPLFFVKDQIKKFVVSQVIMIPIIAAMVKIIQVGGDYFFIYLWFFVVAFTLFMMIIYPEFIAPLFDKYVPLPQGELRTKIEELAASIDFPLYKLFVVEGSKRSSHSNAYFYGFMKFKRIVLFDTLLEEAEREKLKTEEDKKKEKEKEMEQNEKEKEEKEKEKKKGCSTPEILAVLAHELGHWKYNHVLKNIVIAELQILAMFALFKYLYKYQLLYAAFGFETEQPVLIGLMIIMQFITAPVNALLSFAMTVLSRRFEFQADQFAIELGRGNSLRTALIKLNNDNLGFPIYDKLYSAWHHSHPPLLERIDVITNKKGK